MDYKTQRGSVEESLLQELAGQITKEWLGIGRFLGIPEAQLQHLKEDNSNDQKEVIYQMLLSWKHREGSQATRRVLADALQKELTGRIANEWLDIGRFLEIPEADLQRLKADHSSSQRECIYQMLLSWKHREGSQATRRVLADALQKANRKDLAELLSKEGEDRGTRDQPVQVQPPIPVTKPVKPNPQHGDLQSYVNEQGRDNLVIGSKYPTDTTLCCENIRKYGSFATLFEKQTHDFIYHKESNETITAVLVRENWGDGTGGTAEELYGGPGQNVVKVRVTSQMGRGMDFTFSVYGRKA